jgi:quinol monooxygenase YgiN
VGPTWVVTTLAFDGSLADTPPMRSKWKSLGPLEPGGEYLVLASSIPPKSLRSTGRLFRGARAVGKQLDGPDGAMGYSMLAEPLHRRYATLSVWRDEAALQAFAGTEPHKRLMSELAPDMGETRFVRWTIPGGQGAPSWEQALQRLR